LLNNTLSAYTPVPTAIASTPPKASKSTTRWRIGSQKAWLTFAAASFLVSVPVFIQAPLVRLLPWMSLVLTVGWLGLAV